MNKLKLGLLSTLLVSNVSIAQTYLYVVLHDDDGSVGERFRTEMPDMRTCMEAVNTARYAHPSSTGNDYEVVSVMWCGGGFERNYNGTWWKDPSKKK